MSPLTQLTTPSPTAPRRPPWLRIRLTTTDRYYEIKNLVRSLGLSTVCEEARCPNIYECWGEHGTATFMILGEVCTRRCGFCAVTSGRPPAPPDADEPRHVAQAVAAMSLRHVVVTSVDRDDVEDAGAAHFAAVIDAIHEHCPATSVEVLTPDFRGAPSALHTVLGAGPAIFSHNMETVARLYRVARPGSDYSRSLDLLRDASRSAAEGRYAGRVKTGLMVGLGETPGELTSTMLDIREAGVEILTVGQYLQPTREHLPVDRWVHPDEFGAIRELALGQGFVHCLSGPLVRSSYHAHEQVAERVPDGQHAPSAPPTVS